MAYISSFAKLTAPTSSSLIASASASPSRASALFFSFFITFLKSMSSPSTLVKLLDRSEVALVLSITDLTSARETLSAPLIILATTALPRRYSPM